MNLLWRISWVVIVASSAQALASEARDSDLDTAFRGAPEAIPREAEGEVPRALPLKLVASQEVDESPGEAARPTMRPREETQTSPPARPQLQFPIEAVVEPRADGVLIVDYGLAADPPSLQNPFDWRRSPDAPEVLNVRVSSILLGARPTAVLNGKVLSLGEKRDGFCLVHVEKGAVFLEKNGRILRINVGVSVKIQEGVSR